MKLSSRSFDHGGIMDRKYTQYGDNIQPGIGWSDVPDETITYVLKVDDADAPGGIWNHWIVFDIPYNVTDFQENQWYSDHYFDYYPSDGNNSEASDGYGTLVIDNSDGDACNCNGDTLDCFDECGGLAEEDNCGICDYDLSNDCLQFWVVYFSKTNSEKYIRYNIYF